jgi:ribonucleoside-triphosphate reductase
MVDKVRKRDGRLVNFDKNKIAHAIFKSAQDIGGHDKELANKLGQKVSKFLEKEFEKKIPTVEDVQDAVEKVLIENGHAKTAKNFILYRQQKTNLRETKEFIVDTVKLVKDYIGKEDWRVYENANATYSLPGLLWYSSGTIMSFYGLHNVYPKEISSAHISGYFHIHDLSMALAGYCAGWSLRQLLHQGFNGVSGKIECTPPKHLRSAIGQMINFLGTLQNEWAGAQAFNSFDTYLAPFVRADNLTYKEVKQCIQEFVYNMNVATRWSGQTPFTNITLDLTVPQDLKDQKVTIGGKFQNSRYSEFQKEMDMINKALIEVLIEGDAKGRVFTFPIPTYNLTKDFDWNSEIAEKIFEMTAKYGLPYFQNFINSELNPSDVRSMCCRLQLNLKELQKNITSGRFGSGESTGSIGVVTLNLPRIAYESDNESDFFEKLERYMYLAKESLEIKRKIVERNIQKNLLPYTRRYLGNLKHHFSTIGLVGMHEACLNLIGRDKGIDSEQGKNFSIKTLNFMRKKLKDFQQETGNIYNLEATPAEGTSYRLAKKDKQKYSDIITSGQEQPYYTNSTQLPVSYTNDIFKALKHQEPIQKLYTGGTVFHTFLGEAIDKDACKMLVKKIAYNSSLPYFTISPTFSICEQHGYLNDEQHICPKCGKQTEVYSRVVGYYRPVKDWNKGKQEEFNEREVFRIQLKQAA